MSNFKYHQKTNSKPCRYTKSEGERIRHVQKRFSDYETIGGLFRDVSKDTVLLSVAQQIWGVLQEIVTTIAEVFGLLDEEVYEVVINHSDELAHIAKFYNLKSAS